MSLGPGSFAFGYLAGLLSTLSPCVVPLLPILVAGALAQHRLGLWALAVGLALSFAASGLLLATVGLSLGLDAALLRRVGGALLIGFGSVLAVPALQRRFAAVAAPLGRAAGAALERVSGRGWLGQLGVGLLLGLVWTPCVGPTLGAASTLAAQGRQLGEVAALMLVFGIGAATPLVLLGSLWHRPASGARRLAAGGAEAVRRGLGVCLIAVGLLVVAGVDKAIETWLVDASPAWLTELTTRF